MQWKDVHLMYIRIIYIITIYDIYNNHKIYSMLTYIKTQQKCK